MYQRRVVFKIDVWALVVTMGHLSSVIKSIPFATGFEGKKVSMETFEYYPWIHSS